MKELMIGGEIYKKSSTAADRRLLLELALSDFGYVGHRKKDRQFWPTLDMSSFIYTPQQIKLIGPDIHKTISGQTGKLSVLLCMHRYALVWQPEHTTVICAGCKIFRSLDCAIKHWEFVLTIEAPPTRKARARSFLNVLYKLRKQIKLHGEAAVLRSYHGA